MFYNLQKLFWTKMRIFAYTILILIAWSTWWYFTDIAIMLWNYGKIHTYIDIGLSIMMVFGFPLFILALSYKIMLFGNKENLHRKSIIGTIGGIIGTILSGSSCCGLTLASYFGLLPLMGFLPYSWLEIKILGAIGLMYALYDIMKNLEVCRMKKK
jgi:hypothetical protein